MKKGIGICIVVILIVCALVIVLRNKREVNYVTDNEYLYDVAIDYLEEEYTEKETEDSQKEDFQIFFDYEGFGISEDGNIKYAYMWILKESYYVEGGEVKSGAGSSMPYKIKFIDDVVVDFETSKDGSEYVSSIREMFPDDIEEKVLSFSLSDDELKQEVDEYYSYLNSEEYTFIGEIIEVHDNSIIVKPNAGTREIDSSDKYSIEDIGEEVYQVGSKVKIYYDGNVLETYPAQIKASKVELVK